MTIDAAIKSAVGPLVAGGCHFVANTSATITLPYVVFYEVGGTPETGISLDYLGITEHRYQVDVFAQSPEQAKGLSLGVIKDVLAQDVQGRLTFQMTGQFNPVDKTYQYITEYELWAE